MTSAFSIVVYALAGFGLVFVAWIVRLVSDLKSLRPA